MDARCYYADGRMLEERDVDDRALTLPIAMGYRITWFGRTGEVDSDGFVVFKENVAPTRSS